MVSKIRSLFESFYEFAMRGNMIDMAVGIIVGAAFSTVVKSLVDDIIMPPIGLLIGNVDFQDLYVVLREGEAALPPNATLTAANEAGAVTWNYGLFLNNVVSFLILALTVFLVIRAIAQVQERFDDDAEDVEEEKAAERECPYCKMTILEAATRCPHCTSQL